MSGPTLCPRCGDLVGAEDDTCASCGLCRGSATAQATSLWTFFKQHGSAPGFFLGLIVVLFVVMVVAQGGISLFSMRGFESITLIRFGGLLKPFVIELGEWWRMVTAMLIHGGTLHVAMNAFVLFQLGPLCVRYYDHRRMVIFFVLGGLVGTTVSLLAGSFSVGASGAILALLTAIIVKARLSGGAIDRMVYAQLMGWAIFIFFIGFLPIIDGWGHFGGMVGGAVLGYALRDEHGGRERIHTALFWLSVLILALGIGFGAWYAIDPDNVLRSERALGEILRQSAR